MEEVEGVRRPEENLKIQRGSERPRALWEMKEGNFREDWQLRRPNSSGSDWLEGVCVCVCVRAHKPQHGKTVLFLVLCDFHLN